MVEQNVSFRLEKENTLPPKDRLQRNKELPVIQLGKGETPDSFRRFDTIAER